jgi:hypothetical protein
MATPTNVAPELRLLPPESLATLRALNEANLPHRCTVVANTSVGTRVGGALATTPVTLLTAAPCRLVALKHRTPETLVGDQPFEADQWVLIFQVGVVLPEGAVATVTGTDALGAAWTRVVRIGTPSHDRTFEIESRYGARDVFNANTLPAPADAVIGGEWIL